MGSTSDSANTLGKAHPSLYPRQNLQPWLTGAHIPVSYWQVQPHWLSSRHTYEVLVLPHLADLLVAPLTQEAAHVGYLARASPWHELLLLSGLQDVLHFVQGRLHATQHQHGYATTHSPWKARPIDSRSLQPIPVERWPDNGCYRPIAGRHP